VITDQYLIPVDPEAPAGEYCLETGMYDASTMTRLPIRDTEGIYQGDRVLLGPIQVGG
jgi:hypothetical protein